MALIWAGLLKEYVPLAIVTNNYLKNLFIDFLIISVIR